MKSEEVMESCVLTQFGECFYNETGCSDCEIKEKIRKALKKPKTGKWILSDLQSIEEMENGNYYYFCSNCFCSDLHVKMQEVPYCWYCGVKMEERE